MSDTTAPVKLSDRRISVSAKIIQGLGAIPDNVKNYAFGTLLLFYYNQVLGVSGYYSGLALMIAMGFDAITDPLVGSLSDNLRSRLGRRHPFMYAAAVPLPLSIYLLFVPPEGFAEFELFLWLATFAVLVRSSMTLFLVPWTALLAELSQNYEERTSIVSYRFLFGWIAGILTGVLTMGLVFPTTEEFDPGHLNPAGYATFAFWAAITIFVAILVTTHFSRNQIPFMPAPPVERKHFSFGNVFREIRLALTNRWFRLIFTGLLFSGAIGGTTGALGIYMNTYFWGLRPSEMAWFGVAGVGALLAFVLVRPIQRRYDKKTIIVFSSLFTLFEGILFINLRFLDVLPANGDPLLLPILVFGVTIAVIIGTVSGMVGPSIVADILDQQELKTGERQEGMFFSALSFSTKAISGFGVLIGGLILDALAFPRGIKPSEIDPDIVFNLGLTVGIAIPLMHLLPIWIYSRYRLTRELHGEIRRELDERHDQRHRLGDAP